MKIYTKFFILNVYFVCTFPKYFINFLCCLNIPCVIAIESNVPNLLKISDKLRTCSFDEKKKSYKFKLNKRLPFSCIFHMNH